MPLDDHIRCCILIYWIKYLRVFTTLFWRSRIERIKIHFLVHNTASSERDVSMPTYISEKLATSCIIELNRKLFFSAIWWWRLFWSILLHFAILILMLLMPHLCDSFFDHGRKNYISKKKTSHNKNGTNEWANKYPIRHF